MLTLSISMAAHGWTWHLEPGPYLLGFVIPFGFSLCMLLIVAILKLRDLPSNLRARRRPTMTPQQLEGLLQGTPPRIVDLRPREIFEGAKGHIRGAMNIPLSELRLRVGELDARQRDAIVLVDETDRLSHRALPMLSQEGHGWIYVLRGGMRAWRRNKLPVYKYKGHHPRHSLAG